MNYFLLAILLVGLNSFAFSYKHFHYGWSGTKIRMGADKRKKSDKATLFFYNGYSDRMENHHKLFRKLRNNNIRVVSYDYPGHGGSGGWLATWGIKQSAKITKKVLQLANVDASKPLILAGWSTGGLIIARTIQSWTTAIIPAKYDIAGAILIDPAIPAKVFVGNNKVIINGISRGKMKFGPKPKTTYGGGAFTLSLGKQAFQARRLGYLPTDIPVVVYLGDKRVDKYTKIDSTKAWIRSEENRVPIWGFECPNGYHGLEFEPDGIGARIRQMTLAFTKNMASAKRNRIRNTEAVARLLGQEASACPMIQ